jgi:dCMP deaminase
VAIMGETDRVSRPGWDEYFMSIARDVSRRSNCIRRSVGAIIVKGKSIVSTGYNGTPMGVRNCFDGGCLRCNSPVPTGQGYDTCICVHAEANAMLLAARHGTAIENGILYSTLRPCFGCLKEAVQAGIQEIVFEQDFAYEGELEEVYQGLRQEAGLGMRQIQGASPPVAGQRP